MVIERISSRVSPAAAITTAVVLSAAAFLLDFFTPAHFNPSVLYIAALVMIALARSRKLLWGTTVLLVFLTFLGLAIGREAGAGVSRFNPYITLNRAMVILSLAATAVVAHLWTRSMDARERNEKELQAQNDELAAREEEIARQNEELQSQTEELERQSEELRLTNDELSRREQALQALLDLSRSLTAGLSQNE